MHDIFYLLHFAGMAVILIIGSYLFIKGRTIEAQMKKKLALYLMSAAHTQLITGFSLFFIMMSEVNHMKIGIKMLIAIFIAILSTIYRRKISRDGTPHPTILPAIVLSGIAITLIAFFV